jgi:hypothetical protein
MTKATISVVSDESGASALVSGIGDSCNCLFNPSSFSIKRSANYVEHRVPGLDRPILQYINSEAEVMHFSLFFDTYAAGTDTGDLELAVLSKLPTAAKADVSTYTQPFYELLDVDEDYHKPNRVAFKWGSINFEGYVTDINQQFTMFSSSGTPLRATLDITIKSSKQDNNIRNSPDRTKHHMLESSDRLYAIAAKEYGNCAQWRRIAAANNIDNPRLLMSGESIVVPAII